MENTMFTVKGKIKGDMIPFNEKIDDSIIIDESIIIESIQIFKCVRLICSNGLIIENKSVSEISCTVTI